MAGLRFRVVGAQQRIPPASLPLRRGRSPLLFPRGPRGRAPASGTGPGCSERRRCGAAPGRERPEAAPLPAPGGDFAAGGRALAGLPPLLSSPLLSSPFLASRRRSARRRLRNGRLWPPAAGSCHTAEAAAAGARSEPTLPPRMTHGEPALVSLVLAVDGEQPASSAGRGQGKRIAHPELRRRPQGRAPDPGIPRASPGGHPPAGSPAPGAEVGFGDGSGAGLKENISPNSWGSVAVEPLLAHLQRVTAAREPSRALCYFGRQKAAELVPAAAPPSRTPALSCSDCKGDSRAGLQPLCVVKVLQS